MNASENKDFLNVPKELHQYISSIYGITDLPVVSHKQVKSFEATTENITP